MHFISVSVPPECRASLFAFGAAFCTGVVSGWVVGFKVGCRNLGTVSTGSSEVGCVLVRTVIDVLRHR